MFGAVGAETGSVGTDNPARASAIISQGVALSHTTDIASGQ